MENVEKVVCKAFSETLGVSVEQVTLDKDFHQDLGADSLDVIETVMIIEEELGVEVQDEELEGAPTTIKGVVDIFARAAEREKGAKL